MKTTLDQLAVIERRDAWIKRLSQLFFTALFALLLTGAVVAGIGFILDQRETTQRDSRAAASRRIDGLQATIASQNAQIAENAEQLGALSADVHALVAQLRQNNLVPVVTPSTAAASPRPRKAADPSTAPAARPSPRPSRTPAPSRSPRPSPSPSPTCRPLPILGCLNTSRSAS